MDEIVRVTEEEIISAMRLIWERLKIVCEPSSAVALAAVLNKKDKLSGKSGDNNLGECRLKPFALLKDH